MKQRPLKNTSENKLNKDSKRGNGEKKKSATSDGQRNAQT
jgi:hypothetical protein